MKIVIAGSRTIKDSAAVAKAIERSKFEITEVVCGMATGVDKIGQQWGIMHGIPVKEFPADWDKYGNSAGPIRNRKMAEYADAAIIIWDGSSPGSRNMIKEIKKLDKPYFIDVV
ncbi:Mycobacteriophage D29, Gp61 [uncultured Caudovirales phage]|uniref:Mycobacteriophage D29, Gp61 n=1 Tax=uncultured Caudovirales phage TaxID=2100421 RepID=A0A6J5P0L6_9CAUD|nr:Mycobacteriophage D29, Gp61 [uncultured Caudovirales phage]